MFKEAIFQWFCIGVWIFGGGKEHSTNLAQLTHIHIAIDALRSSKQMLLLLSIYHQNKGEGVLFYLYLLCVFAFMFLFK